MKLGIALAVLFLSVMAVAQTTSSSTSGPASQDQTVVAPATKEQMDALQKKIHRLEIEQRKAHQAELNAQRSAKAQIRESEQQLADQISEYRTTFEALQKQQAQENHKKTLIMEISGGGIVIVIAAFGVWFVRRVRKDQGMAGTGTPVVPPKHSWQASPAEIAHMKKFSYDPHGLLASDMPIAPVQANPKKEQVSSFIEWAKEQNINTFILFAFFKNEGRFVPFIVDITHENGWRIYNSVDNFERRDRGGRYSTWDRHIDYAAKVIRGFIPKTTIGSASTSESIN